METEREGVRLQGVRWTGVCSVGHGRMRVVWRGASPPAEAVLAVGEGDSWVPAVEVMSVADVVASTIPLAA